VGIGAGGPHIADESWELDRGCDSVLWCGILKRGVDPRGVDLGGVSLSEVLTSLHILLTLTVASLLCLSLLQPEYDYILHSRIYTAFTSLLGS
jgi:hypothetical protein